MRSVTYSLFVVGAMLILIGASAAVDAAPPPPAPPMTLWRFLGIPQGMNKMRDTTSNRRGNHPGLERKDPIKRIADAANLESKNPAIKAAAEIKAEQDLAPQKIKAIKFLATVGCGCYPGVKEALLAAMDDCTEEVRYEAAVAFCQVAGNSCNNCEKTCCNAAVMEKLEEKAHGQDDKCCYKESSARVRQAAEMALNACRQKVGSTAPPALPEPGKGPETAPTIAPKTPETAHPDSGKPTVPAEPSPMPKVEPTPGAVPPPPKAAALWMKNKPSEMFQVLVPVPDDRPRDRAVMQATALTPVPAKARQQADLP